MNNGEEGTAQIWERHGEAITTALCAGFVTAGWLAARAGAPALASTSLFVAGYGLGGYRQAIEGVTTLVRERELDVDLLMVVAAIGAAAIGYWFDGALLIFIFALSGTLEGYASARTRRDIEALIALRPDESVVERGGREVRVPAESVVVGDVVVVRPGERISADGEVLEGESAVNQAHITGESVPVARGPGHEVFAGTINGQGALRVRATRPPADSVLARIILLVKQAEELRPPAQLFIERFERGYARVVVLGAVALVAAPWAAGLWSFRESLYRAMIFLVVASPCALAAAMMPTLLSALSNGARSGVLFKGSAFIETLARVRAVAFDKTGTLTSGHPRLTDVLRLGEATEDALVALAAGVERLSEHPLGRAVVAEAARRGLSPEPGAGLQSIVATGARARVSGVSWAVGKASLFDRVPAAALAAQGRLEAEGKTVVFVGDDEPRGVLAFRDSLRPGVRAMVEALRRLGVEHVVMLTGDSRATAEAIAREAGIAEVHAGLLPQDKLRIIEDLARRHGPVAMVGDGVNDAPAMAAAAVGIAMGAGGTDVALETADVVLTAGDLDRLPFAIALGRRALSVVKQNLLVALTVIVALVASDLLGLITLPWGVVGHEGSTLLVTLNGLRLLMKLPGFARGAAPGAAAPRAAVA